MQTVHPLDGGDRPVTWTSVCRLDDLEPLWGEAALVDGEQAALFLLPDGAVFAVSNRDPATGACVMSRGIVGSRGTRYTIASPLHKEVYDLETGECFTSPELVLGVVRVRLSGRVVQLGLPSSALTATESAA